MVNQVQVGQVSGGVSKCLIVIVLWPFCPSRACKEFCCNACERFLLLNELVEILCKNLPITLSCKTERLPCSLQFLTCETSLPISTNVTSSLCCSGITLHSGSCKQYCISRDYADCHIPQMVHHLPFCALALLCGLLGVRREHVLPLTGRLIPVHCVRTLGPDRSCPLSYQCTCCGCQLVPRN